MEEEMELEMEKVAEMEAAENVEEEKEEHAREEEKEEVHVMPSVDEDGLPGTPRRMRTL